MMTVSKQIVTTINHFNDGVVVKIGGTVRNHEHVKQMIGLIVSVSTLIENEGI